MKNAYLTTAYEFLAYPENLSHKIIKTDKSSYQFLLFKCYLGDVVLEFLENTYFFLKSYLINQIPKLLYNCFRKESKLSNIQICSEYNWVG